MTNAYDIDFNDLQGLLRFAHGQLSEACFLLLKVIDPKAAREWLRTAPVTTAATANPLPERALQVAFTAPGLRALGMPAAVINGFSEEFITGMVADDNQSRCSEDVGNRSRRLGDVGNNKPACWKWGGAEANIPHLVIMLYACLDGLDAWQEQIQGPGFDNAFQLTATLKSALPGPQEPFGFVDGISQPEIDWQRSISTDRHERDRYSNKLAVGELLLGHPNEYGLYTTRPLLDPKSTPAAHQLPLAEDQPKLRDLGRNGTYLVVRQLEQDVPRFWKYVDGEANSDAEERERLAAAMVGRQRDGTPLVEPDSAPATGNADDGPRAKADQFTFDADPHGERCPIGAHIRRANPRTGDFPVGVSGMLTRLVRTLGFGRRHAHDDLIASARFHRILRRGRVYGPALTPEDAVKADATTDERGLHFVCLGASIVRQFEFVQNAWAMSTRFAGVSRQSDPLLGNREPLLNGEESNQFTIPQPDAPARCLKDMPQFVTVRGGAYFFMPGIKALQFIASDPSEGG